MSIIEKPQMPWNGHAIPRHTLMYCRSGFTIHLYGSWPFNLKRSRKLQKRAFAGTGSDTVAHGVSVISIAKPALDCDWIDQKLDRHQACTKLLQVCFAFTTWSKTKKKVNFAWYVSFKWSLMVPWKVADF